VSNAVEQVRAWAAPFLVSIICGLGLVLWNSQQGRIASLEDEVGKSRLTLAVIADNQENGREERNLFQQSVSQRLDRMEDVLTDVGKSLAALAAIQQRQEKDLGR
jgi:hypothetical protein